MIRRSQISGHVNRHSFRTAIVLVCLCAPIPALATAQQSGAAPAVVDRVVAVVNNRVILESEIEEEIRLAVLDPNRAGLGVLTPQTALQQLISRSIIQQQIRAEDAAAMAEPPNEVQARIGEIRRELPSCVRLNCASEAGWNAFLAAHDLTRERVENYVRLRLQILRFIEMRFRLGIRIPPKEIEDYYKDTLLPQYLPGETVPALDQVAPRIQEILLQRHVNELFDEWLRNLRDEGEIEILDPALEMPEEKAREGNAP